MIVCAGRLTMQKRIAVVTGGTGGLGTAMCKDLFKQDRTVVAAYFPPEEMQAMAWQEKQKSAGWPPDTGVSRN